MSRFLYDAEQILGAAVSVAGPNLAILVYGQRGIRLYRAKTIGRLSLSGRKRGRRRHIRSAGRARP